MTLTAMRPPLGLSNGRLVSLCRVSQASSLISAFRVVFRLLYGSFEEALFVVVRVDEPASDAVGVAADDFATLRFEDIHAVNGDLCQVVGGQSQGEIARG
jgi:hypothetical protein